jgi:hypothetical protein
MVVDSTKLAPSEFLSSAALAQLPAAGAGGAVVRETARDALSWDRRPSTPPTIKQGGYQHYARQDPGTITRHFGAARDAAALPPGPFGYKSKVGTESAAACFKMLPDTGTARWRLERAEDVYVSHRQEPLGAVPSHGHRLPPGAGTAVPFGRPLHVREQERLNSTKDTIFPTSPSEDPASTQRYARSHGSFAPGEQRRRGYDWGGGIDPGTHRFGLSGAEVARRRSVEQQASMKQILQPELDNGVAVGCRLCFCF